MKIIMFLLSAMSATCLGFRGVKKTGNRKVSLQMAYTPENPRTFTSYVIYKGKAALSLKPIPPTFASKGSSRIVSKNGGLLLEFAPASGVREYDWTKKGTFLLGPTECGDILTMRPDNKEGLEFLRDPKMGSPQTGNTAKKLRILPITFIDGRSMFISLQISGKSSEPVNFNLPLRVGELAVIQTLISYCLPRFLAFDCVWDWSSGNTSSNDSDSIY